MQFDMGITFDAEITHCCFDQINNLLRKYSINIDLTSNKSLLDNTMGVYVMGKCRLSSLKCVMINEDGVEIINIEDSPEYKYLKGDKDNYIHYYKDIAKKYERHNPERYDELIKTFDTAYDDSYLLEVEPNGNLIDGNHRAAFLYHKYGKDHSVRFLCPIFTAKNTGCCDC